jgi:hypothetical protein
MANRRSLLSGAISSSLSPPSATPRPALRRLRWAHIDPPTECSPSTTSKPITIPGESALEPQLRHCWQPVPNRHHHRLDDVTDYHLLGTGGWDFAHWTRLEKGEREAGKILAGSWTSVSMWKKSVMARKDVDFNQDKKQEQKDEEKQSCFKKRVLDKKEPLWSEEQSEDDLIDSGCW